MARKRVKCHIRSHFRTMNSNFISDKMGENARSNAKCLSEAYQNAKFGTLCLVWLIIWLWRSKTWAAWSKKPRISQGHPTTVFCKICVRRSKYYLEFSITWGRLKSSRWPYHLCRIFEAYLITEIPFEFLSLTSHISLPRLGYFSWRSSNLTFSDSKIWRGEKSDTLAIS